MMTHPWGHRGLTKVNSEFQVEKQTKVCLTLFDLRHAPWEPVGVPGWSKVNDIVTIRFPVRRVCVPNFMKIGPRIFELSK